MRTYKTEINPTPEQKRIIHQTIGVCRFIYNFYLAHNKEIYEKEKRFVSGYDFSKWLNNEFILNNPEYKWIKEVSSKAVKQAIMNGEKAFRRYFKGQSKYPRFKKKNKQNVKAYFPKNNKNDWTIERHKLKIPTFGFVRLKEKGYIPTNTNIKSGTVSMKAEKYYVSVLVDEERQYNFQNFNEGLGIDLGIKDFAIVSNIDKPFKNINRTSEMKKIEKSLKRQQRKLSRKYESLKKSKKQKEAPATRQNIQKQVLKVQKLHQRITNIRENYVNQTINEIIKQKPRFITIENLNISGMMKNRHLSKAIAQQCFYQFKIKLVYKCKIYGVELRIVDHFYPSSKLCSCCGFIKKDLKLSDRIYTCNNCENEMDRDKNASVNLKNAKEYTISC